MQFPAEIRVMQYDFGNREVGEYNLIAIQLALPTIYEAEGYLTVTLPETVQISNDFQCIYHINFMSSDRTGSCSIVSNSNNKVIRIDKNISDRQITFQINMLINPPHTKETGDFVFHIYDPSDNMIAQTSPESDPSQ